MGEGSTPAADDIDGIRKECRPIARLYTALRSTTFYRDWLIVWGSPGDFAERGFLTQAGQGVATLVADGEHIVIFRQAKRGTYPYSEMEKMVQKVLAAHLYKCSRLLAGAIAASEGVSQGEPGAASVITSLLLPLRSVLRSGKRVKAEDWVSNLYAELRNDIGPPVVRALYGEKPKTSELEMGARWFARGLYMGNQHPHYNDIEHQLPEIADALMLLEKMIELRIRVARMASGERRVNAVLNGEQPIPLELVEPILWDREETKRPRLEEMTRIAFCYDIDISLLYPKLSYLRPHLLASAAIGQHARTGLFDEEPSAHWGLLGLIDETTDHEMHSELAASRAFLRGRLSADLKSRVLNKTPGPILRPLDILKVRRFRQEQEAEGN